MAAVNQVFKCEKCGSMVAVLHASDCDPACCGQAMRLLAENTTDAAREKHVPAIERTAEGYIVRIGSVPHPMEADHYIEWIELLADGISHRRFLKPGDKPEASFCLKAAKVEAREYCNKHGLWKAES